ncbi:coiled-coil domain-containing protein 159 isoform X3 [Podarcis muralis]
MPFFRPRGRAPPQHGNQDSAPRRRIAMGGVCGCAKQQRHEGRRGHEGPRPFVTRREAVRGIPRAALRQLLSAPGRASGGRSGQSRAMDSREEVVLATTEPLLMPVSHNDMCRNLSPSWCLSRAGSPMPMHAQSQLEIATMKPTLMVPESQMVKNEVDLIKAQLYAQTKAFQALSHSITLLEQESNQQQGRIKELEEEVQFFARSPRGEMFDSFIQKRIQDVWKVMSREVQGLHGSMIEKESSMENLSQAVLESKKLLWEELEAVQGELRRIHQKLIWPPTRSEGQWTSPQLKRFADPWNPVLCWLEPCKVAYTQHSQCSLRSGGTGRVREYWEMIYNELKKMFKSTFPKTQSPFCWR